MDVSGLLAYLELFRKVA